MFNKIVSMAALFVMVACANAPACRADGVPVKVVGARHVLVLLSDGKVVGWGAVDLGALGPQAAIPQDTKHAKQLVSIKLPRKALDIAVMGDSSLALLDDGTVVQWGEAPKSETPVEVPNLSGVVKIVASSGSALALRNDGTVIGFGPGSHYANVSVPGLKNIKEIAVAPLYGMALDASGEVWTWAHHENAIKFGVLGRETDPFTPQKIEGLHNVISLSAQPAVSTVVKKDGTVWVWGSNNSAQLGNGRKSDMPNRGTGSEVVFKPQQVSGIANAVSLANTSSALHTIVLLKDGTLRSWGNSQLGQTGNGTTGDYVTHPVTPKITGVKSIYGITMNSYAIKSDNTLWFWGASTTWGFPYNKTLLAPKLLPLK